MFAVKLSDSWRGATVVLGLLSMAPLVSAEDDASNSVVPLGAPNDASSAMYSLQDVCQRLDDGTTGSLRGGAFNEPPTGPEETSCSLNELMEKAPAVSGDAVSAEEVLSGKTFWSLKEGVWGKQSGTAALGDSVEGVDGELIITIPDGMYYGDKVITAIDANLVSTNIKSGSTIFGVTGDINVVDTSAADATASEVAFGKIAYVGGAEVVGTLEAKVLEDTSDIVAPGIYEETTLSTVDADLVSTNIKSGVTIFGVAGDINVVDTSAANAVAAEIALGKTAYVDGDLVTGTLESSVGVLSDANDTVAAGVYEATRLSDVDTDLASANIKSGVTIFGVAGDINVVDTRTANAVAAEIVLGKTAYVGGSQVTGTLETMALTDTSDTVAAGIYEATTLSTVDTDLASANIKSGVTIFGISGDDNVVDTVSGDAVSTDLAKDKKAWVDGVEVTGTVAVGENVAGNTLTMIIPDGIYSATKTATASDVNLIAENIKCGVEIFGVTGTANCL